MAGTLRISRYDDHQIQQIHKMSTKQAMTSLINPSYDSNAISPSDQVNANTTTTTTTDHSLSNKLSDALENDLKALNRKQEEPSTKDSNFTFEFDSNGGGSKRNSGSGKSRTKYASTDLSEMGIGNPLEALVDSDGEMDERLTVADDNILRERNKKKAEAMFADIDFIDDGEEDDYEDEDEDEDEEEEDEQEMKNEDEVAKDNGREKDTKRMKITDKHEDIEDREEPKDPDADIVSPDEEVRASQLGGFLRYYANLESITKGRMENPDDEITSINGSISDSDDDSEIREGLYEPPQHATPYDSGPSTMDDDSTDCESTYEMLYNSFGLRVQEEGIAKELLSPSNGQHDHGYVSETSVDDKASPIKRPGMLLREGSKPSLSTLIEDSRSGDKTSQQDEAESGVEITPEPKTNKDPLKKSTLQKPTSLPPGWKEVADMRGTYYWHVPSGTTQWNPPSPVSSGESSTSPPRKPARSLERLNTESEGQDGSDGDHSLKDFQQSTIRYANLKLGPNSGKDPEPPASKEKSPRGIRFHVRSLGWVEMEDSDLSPGKSSLAVNNCIRQLSYRKNDIRDTAGIWGEGKDMYMVLEDEYLKLTDPNDGTILNSQHVCSIRVWGVGRDNGRDFAYVARDKVTKRYKCHVFRCDIPAKAIANALHEICARVMSERQKGHTISMVTQGQMIQQQQQQQLMQMRSISLDSSKEGIPTSVDFPTPKAEPITVFRAHYVGSTMVEKHGGMDILNNAINQVCGEIPEDQWSPSRIEVAVSTVTVTNIKTKEIITESRIRFLSFLGIGNDIRQFAYIMCVGKQKFQCHVFHCEHSAGGLAKSIEAACKLRYQKCLDNQPKGQHLMSENSVDGRTWGCALKNGMQNLFSKFSRRSQKEAPISAV
ncbi:amyloid beta A4 precursor protein-binding family B member 2-like isoform X2 [Acanthaster planci]|uniref:Amyloid beta A4 precursor protein-binding family B member 2-like isoform X2 n=1 Tax=Acanthaster planci TaxID=133434 RepID=A0A8B7Z036_ACAPL|nr:amyloid beta A4 precursor protein-binding family B member 2-like isoform X2 [Acanthaster planci]